MQSSLTSEGDENHDFFYGLGSCCVIGPHEEITDEDWGF